MKIIYADAKIAVIVDIGIIHGIGGGVICHNMPAVHGFLVSRSHFAIEVHHLLGHIGVNSRIETHGTLEVETAERSGAYPSLQFHTAVVLREGVILLGKRNGRTKIGKIQKLALGSLSAPRALRHQSRQHRGTLHFWHHYGRIHGYHGRNEQLQGIVAAIYCGSLCQNAALIVGEKQG